MSRDHWNEFLILTISGLGLSVSPPVFVGSIFIAIACGVLARMFSHTASRRSLALTLVAAVCTGLVYHYVAEWRGWAIPFQLVMAMGGLTSAFAIPFFLKIGTLVSQRADRIVDGALDKVLPVSKKGSDK